MVGQAAPQCISCIAMYQVRLGQCESSADHSAQTHSHRTMCCSTAASVPLYCCAGSTTMLTPPPKAVTSQVYHGGRLACRCRWRVHWANTNWCMPLSSSPCMSKQTSLRPRQDCSWWQLGSNFLFSIYFLTQVNPGAFQITLDFSKHHINHKFSFLNCDSFSQFFGYSVQKDQYWPGNKIF